MTTLIANVTDRRPVAISTQLVGEVDLAGARELSQALQQMVALGPTPVLVADLSDTTFMDSTGIEFVAELQSLATSYNARLYIVSPRACVARVLDLCGLAEAVLDLGQRREPQFA